MARRAEAEAIYLAADAWKKQCLLGEGSIFLPNERLWTIEHLKALQRAFTGNPLIGSEEFLAKFETQLNRQKPEVIQLAAEMLWVLFLFPRKLISTTRKRQVISTVMSWSRLDVPQAHEGFSDAVLMGIGSAGTAFNTQRDRELEALIDITETIKAKPSLLSNPWILAEAIDGLPNARRRNIRHILLHLLFPFQFERIASLNHKRRIVSAFSDRNLTDADSRRMSAIDLDEELLRIRATLEERSPDSEIDFYEPELKSVWAEVGSEVDGASEAARGSLSTYQINQRDGVEGDSTVFVRGYTGPKLNIYAWAGVWEANRLASAAGLREPDPDLLLAAYLLLAGHPHLGSRTALVLERQISDRMRALQHSADPGVDFLLQRYGLPALPVFDDLPQTPPNARLQQVLNAAEEIRLAVAGGKTYPLSTRHVLTVLLRPGPDSVTSLLEQHGLSPDELRARVFSSVASAHSQENREEWQRLLLGSVPFAQPEPPSVYAGFSTDGLPTDKEHRLTRADDRLKVMSDVTSLCEVLVAHHTRPPLAVGLFGDWGTGKSFFMELMKNEVELLGKQNPSFYCSRVVQVWFNAWHYMDTNLWASMASRVFESLAEQLEEWKEPEDSRKNLFNRLQESRGVLTEAVEQKADAKARLAAIQRERVEKKKRVVDSAGLALKAAVTAVSADKDVQRKLQAAKDQLGLTDAQAQLENAGKQARELRSLVARVYAIGRAVLREPKFVLLGIFTFVVTVGLMRWALDNSQIAKGASRLLLEATVALGSVCLAIAPVVRKVNRAVHWLEDAHTRLNQQLHAEQRQEELEVQRDILRLDEREREAQEQVEALTRDIEEMRAGRRLERFIMERHKSAEYRQQLGIVSLIRNDFHQLSTLLSESAREREQGSASDTAGLEYPVYATAVAEPEAANAEPSSKRLPRIDRIILYIDDLDRCPEDRVVEVLQAVHLLLAFPLFVVVVGVDSRWLLLSLEDHYAALRGRSGPPRDGSVESDPEWTTTPQNYLEKIFQIPLTLRPMESEGFGSLVDALLPLGGGDRETTDIASEAGFHEVDDGDYDPDEESAIYDVDDSADTHDAAAERSPKGANPRPPNPEGLTVEAWERKFIRNLHPLIASPRALKRFTNIYRLIRVQQRGPALDRFRGTESAPGEFQVLALLLAALVGYPAEATLLLRRAVTSHGTPWWDMVEELGEEKGEGEGNTGDSRRRNDERGRPSLYQALWELNRTIAITAHPPEAYARWARDVARFSFQSGRILSMRAPGSVLEPRRMV